MAKVNDYLDLWRPKHWLKNAFVLMPLPFALVAGGHFYAGRFALGLAGFCLAASAVYAFNDALDAAQDRKHARKQHRPVAAGRVSPGAAIVSSLVLLAVGLALAALSGSRAALVILLVYVSVNIAYSLGAKNVALLDVFLLSSGFVLRVLLGCALLEVPPSTWLLLCSSTLALFLALAKRRGDLVRGVDSEHRPSLRGYSLGFLNQAIAISAAMTLLAYALYCMEAAVLRAGREFASFPFVLFGVLDYLRMTDLDDGGDSPVELVLSSPSLWLAGIGWVLATVWSVGLF